MLQIATFRLPEEQEKANEFLKTHVPAGEISFNNNMLFVGYDDGIYDPKAQINELIQDLRAVHGARFQQEVALHVMEYEIADLNPKHNKPKYDQLTSGIIDVKRAMSIQDQKAAFVEKRIAELQAGNAGNKDTSAEKAAE